MAERWSEDHGEDEEYEEGELEEVYEDEEEEQEEEVEETAAAGGQHGSHGASVNTGATLEAAAGSEAAVMAAVRTALAGRAAQPAVASQGTAESSAAEPAAVRQMREKLLDIRVKLLRLAQRLGQSHRNTVVAQVLYRLELAEKLKAGAGASGGGSVGPERANAMAEQAEQQAGADSDLGFSCTILLLGKTGVGKSATINSLLGSNVVETSAFESATKEVRMIETNMHGIKLRLIDTPGLRPCASDTRYNSSIMAKAKAFTKRHPPDIVLYFDRLDASNRADFGDLPLLRTITNTFGAAVWFNAIVVLTHASTAPPDGANGQPMSYETYVAQRSHVVQQTIRQAAGDIRLMNPVSLAENHPNCRTNRTGDRVLPNGHVWKPQLLLLCFASKILTEANALLNLQDSNARQMGSRQKLPPLPFLLSSLITSRPPRKLYGDEGDDSGYLPEETDGAPAEEFVEEEVKQVSIPAPDPALPPTFDSETPVHHFRFLESASQWVVRPIVESHGWDHEAGIESFSLEKGFVVRKNIPANISGQIAKDKKDANLTIETEASVKHSNKLVTTSGLDIQTVGKQLAYTLRSETRWKNLPNNKTAGGVSASYVAGALALGAKVEDRWKVRPGSKLVLNCGVITSKGDTAFGGNLEGIMRHQKDDAAPTSTTVGASFMKWRGDVALGGNVQTQVNVDKDTQVTARANLNSRGSGQLTLRASTNEKMQLGLLGAVPILCAVYGRLTEGSG